MDIDLLELKKENRYLRKLLCEYAQTYRGGYTKDFLNAIGVSWPPPSGWRKKFENEGF